MKIMKRVATIVAALIVLLVVTAPAQSQTSYKLFFPISRFDSFPPCHKNGSVGIAWLDRTGAGETMGDAINKFLRNDIIFGLPMVSK
jgi:hypothetical protein